jgi:hypothetical protein
MKCPNFQFENPEGDEVLLGLWGQKGRKEEWAPVRMKWEGTRVDERSVSGSASPHFSFSQSERE